MIRPISLSILAFAGFVVSANATQATPSASDKTAAATAIQKTETGRSAWHHHPHHWHPRHWHAHH
jgi:hypothetical protein